MENYSRLRPSLPDSTPFLPNSSFAVRTPWHATSVVRIVQNKANIQDDNNKDLKSISSKALTKGSRPRLAVNEKFIPHHYNGNKYQISPRISSTNQSVAQSSLQNSTHNNNFRPYSESKLNSTIIDTIHLEHQLLIQEMNFKQRDIENIKAATKLIHDRSRTMEKIYSDLKDQDLENESRNSTRQRAISKFSNVNMMLITSLQALELKPENNDGLSDLMLRYRASLLPELNIN